jgi:ENTS family enterobactin (siderophore) exporter
MWFGASLSGVGTQLTTVAVGLQVYDLTGSTFRVGLVGLFAVIPLVSFGLYGGSIVDAHDRRRVVLVTATGLLSVAIGFATQAWLGIGSVWLLYGLVAVQSGLFAVNTPARSAIVPRLLPSHLLPAANALTGLSSGAAFTLGPLMAGPLVSQGGYGAAYSVQVLLLAVALMTLIALPPLPPEGTVRRAGLGSVLEGLRYLRTRPNLRMTFFVDLAAMVLAMPRVLFPALGAAVIGGGATTVGILVAAIAAGSMMAGLLSGPLGRVRRQGLAVLVAVVGWGLAITAFGVVVTVPPGPAVDGTAHWILWPAVGCLVVAGAADAVSSVFRHTILQAATPDRMRGRLQGVFIVVVAGGPHLGDLVLGTAAQVGTEALAAIVGGLACVGAVIALGLLQPRFARYDARHPAP